MQLIQTDNGAEFQSAFHWHVLDRGTRHVYIKPATPRLNGKVERSCTHSHDRLHLRAAFPSWPDVLGRDLQ